MDTYERPHGKTLLARLREEPRWLTIITGPRQTGKTTLVEQVLRRIQRPSVHIAVDAPDPATFPVTTGFRAGATSLAADISLPPVDSRDTRWLVRTWEEARLEARASDRGFVLALDEIQKVPNWSETVKGLWDADRRERLPLHVVLLGSAPLLMQQGMSESLAGRYEVIDVEHWSFAEMAAAFDFDLDRFVYFGGYPGPAPLARDETRWRSFIHRSLIEPNIERDILALQRVDKPILLKQLFGLGAAYSGQILSYNKMLGQLDEAGNTTTLARYLDLLSKRRTDHRPFEVRQPSHTGAEPRVPSSTCSTPRSCRSIRTTPSSRHGRTGRSGAISWRPRLARIWSTPGVLSTASTTGVTGDERWTSSWSTAANWFLSR